MAKKLTDRERIETIFKTHDKAECDFLLVIANIVMRSRFGAEPAKRGRKPKGKLAPTPLEAAR